MPKVEPPSIASDQDYAQRLGDLATWGPLARAALELAGIPQPARVQIASPLGTYPTLLASTRPWLVIKLFGDRYCGPESHAAESSAYQVLAGHDLPVPRLVAAGDLFPGQPTWPWPFLVVTALRGRRYAALASRLDAAQRTTIARSLGRLLCRLHNLPLPPASTPGPCHRTLGMRTARTLIVNTNGSTDGPGRAPHRLTTLLVAGARDRLVRDPAERRPTVRHLVAWPDDMPQGTRRNGVQLVGTYGEVGDARRLRLGRKPLVITLSVHPWPTNVSRNRPLVSSWDRFLALLHRRRCEVAGDHRRWGLLPTRLCDQLEVWLSDPDTLVDPSRPPVFVHGDLHDEHIFVDPSSATLTGVIDFTDVYAGDPRYDLVALHFHTFRLDTTLLRACLDAYGWGHRRDDWPQAMLTFTLLHDFNMFRPDMQLDRFATLDELANAIWGLS